MLTGVSCGKARGVWSVSTVKLEVPVVADCWEVACDALECDETWAMLLWMEL